MAGLLGTGWEDPQSNAIMQLAGGLLSGNFGQGAAAYGSTMAGAQDAALRRKMTQMQMDNYSSEIEARKLAAIKDARMQKMQETFMNGDSNPEAVSPGAFSPSADGSGPVMPLSAPQAQQGVQGGAMAYARSIGIPEKAIQADMTFNGGKGIADMMFKRGASDMQVTNGYAYDKNKLGAGYLPSLSTSQDGKTSMVQIGPDGMPVVSAPRGSLETFGSYQDAQAARKPIKVFNPQTQREEYTNEGAVVGGQKSGRTGDPLIDAYIQTESNFNPNAISPKGAKGPMQVMDSTSADPGFGVKPARNNSKDELTRVGVDFQRAMQERYKDPALAAIAYNWGPGNTDMWLKGGGDYSKLPKETQSYVAQVMTRNGVNGRAPQSGNFAAGPSATESATAEANKTRMVDSSKAGTARIMTGYDNAQSALDTITSIGESRKAIQGGSFVGSGAETKLSISKGLQSLGFDVKPDQVSNTDYLNSQLGQGILNKAKTLGANPTDNDARIIRDIVGSIGKDPQALNKLLDFQESMARKSIDQHNKNYTDAKGRGFDAGFDMNISAPVKAGDKPNAAQTFDAKPPAQQFKGKTATGPDGKRYKSDGFIWKEVQ